jgi:hypothetical protein
MDKLKSLLNELHKDSPRYRVLDNMKVKHDRMIIRRVGTRNCYQEEFEVVTEELPAVKITMPEDDYYELTEVYKSHVDCLSQHPAVRDAWDKYITLLNLTRN